MDELLLQCAALYSPQMRVVLWALLLMTAIGAGADPQERIDLRAFRGSSYREVARLADLSEPLSRRVAQLIDQPIAEKGAPWNATDVIIGDSNPPVRRFVIAGETRSRSFVVYEHGGIARHQHLLAFEKSAAAPKLVANVFLPEVQSVREALVAMRKPLRTADHF